MNARILLPSLPDDDDGAPAAAGASTVSTHELRRFLAGELSAERRAHIESDASLQPRLQALVAEQRAEDAAFRLDVPLPRFLADHEKRKANATVITGLLGKLSARLASLRWTMGAGALAAGACAVFLMVRAPVDEDPIRSKGGRVGFLVRESAGARFGIDGEELPSGAQIQFAVRDDAKHAAMVVVGVDGRGAVTVYAAERVDERVKGESSEKTRLLPDSIVLDDATGAERFFVVYGDGDVDDVLREVEAAARQLAASHASLVDSERLTLPARYTQSSVHIVKVRVKVPSG